MGSTMCCGGGRLSPADNYKEMEKKIKAADIPQSNAQAWAKFFADGAAVSEFAIDHTDLRAAQQAGGDAKMRAAIQPMIAKYKANVEAIFAEVFAKHDTDNSGYLDKSEFKAVLQEWAKAQDACLSNCIDAIGNAYVDKTMELIRAQGIGAGNALMQIGGTESLVRMKINEHLNAMEKKQRARLADIMSHADQYADRLFVALDPDNTGKISCAVFVENNRKPFAELLKGEDFGRVDLVGEAFNPQRFDVDNLHRL